MKKTEAKHIYFAAYPIALDENPSIGLFHNALSEQKIVNRQFKFEVSQLFLNRRICTLLLFHWPSYFWHSERCLFSWIKFFNFAAKVLFAKLMGYKLLWSAHNTYPHNIQCPKLEKYSRLFLINQFHLILNHSLNASDERFHLFGKRGRMEVNAIHGHYKDLYTPAGKYSRESLGIPSESKVIFLHANMRDYKGDSEFIDYFIKFAPESLYLILMGKSPKEISSNNIKVIKGYLSNGEMADLISLSDFFALPYKKITTSGAFFLAVTFKKAMISTDLPFFRLHSLPGTTLFYENREESFNNVMESIKSGWRPDYNNLSKMKEIYTWENAAKKVRDAVFEMLGNVAD